MHQKSKSCIEKYSATHWTNRKRDAEYQHLLKQKLTTETQIRKAQTATDAWLQLKCAESKR